MPLVDDEALGEALRSGQVAVATREARDTMGFRAISNLDAVFAGREPGNRVA